MSRILPRALACLCVAVVVAVTAWPSPCPMAQEQAPERQDTSELARLHERWQETQDPEQKIALGEQALALERALVDWPLQAERDRVKGELNFQVGFAYAMRQQGDRADNLEKSIAHYEAALTAYTRAAFPEDWALTQHNLGVAYWGRIGGERGDNLEKAIAHLDAALEVRTREAVPRDWALTQFSLGLAYDQRVRGERADNLERAIGHHEAALEVFTPQAFPQERATVLFSLGPAYSGNFRGDRSENLEKAIAATNSSLAVWTREAFPLQWASAQDNLCHAYSLRQRGERADNVEKAIAACEEALKVRTREAFPHEWATSQHNLGFAYSKRIRGDVADNVEQAIAYFGAALAVRTREASPQDWAQTQSMLGSVYMQRVHGEQADSIDYAIETLEAALTVLTREAFPRDWATAQNFLALAHWRRTRGDPADNLEKAIAASEATLTVWTREALPQGWAVIQNILGFAYANRTRGERAANLEKAIAHLEATLTVYMRKTFPREHLRVTRMLGSVFTDKKDWQKAGEAYGGGREAFLLLYGEGLGADEARALISEAGSLFAEAAFAAAERGELEHALALASEGKARQMAVALRLQTLDLVPDQRRRLDELRIGIRAKERIILASEGAARSSAIEELIALRSELLDIVKSAGAGRSDPSSALAQARSLVAGGGAIVAPVVTKAGAKILIVTGAKDGPTITVLDLPDLTTDKVDELMRGERAGVLGGWLGAYNINYIEDRAELEKRWPEWTHAIGNLGPALWRLGGQRLHAALTARGVKRGARLIWLPTGALGILPVGLAQDPVSKRRFADDYEIVYAPNLEALTTARGYIAKSAKPSLAAIVNPTGDLPGTEKEGAVAASYFAADARTLLETKAATVEGVLAVLKGKTHWHFASHGTFSWDDAVLSALIVHGHDRLTVGRMMDTDGLGRPRLVVLSACETGLYDIDHNPDEFVGLPVAFAALGAAGVLGTLWPVPDEVTALLMARFYELHMGSGLAPPTALARAQSWLRRTTNAALLGYAKVALKQGRLQSRHVAEIEQALTTEGLRRSRNRALVQWIDRGGDSPGGKKARTKAVRTVARPYAHPCYWAGFIHTGL